MFFGEILIYLIIFSGLYFSIFIFWVFLENQGRIYQKEKNKKFPLVSLIVPCYNEEKGVEKTLYSLISLDYPKDKLEIIFVDDGSLDSTLQKAKLIQKKDKRIKVFHQENKGKFMALNLGLEKTKGEFIATVDGDSYLHSSALKRAMKFFENPEIKAVSGTAKLIKPRNLIEGIQRVEYLIANFWRKIFSFLNSLYLTSGAFSVYRREIFETLGPFRDPKLFQTEDLEMAFRLQKENLKIVQAMDAFVYTRPPFGFMSLLKQRTRWYAGFLQNFKEYSCLLSIKKYGNLAFFLWYIIFSVLFSIILVGYFIQRGFEFFLQLLNQFILTDFDFSYFFSLPKNWEFLNLNITPLFVLTILCLFVFFFNFFLSRKLSFDSQPYKKGIFFFIFLYPYFNALWWISAFWSFLSKNKKEFLWLKKEN